MSVLTASGHLGPTAARTYTDTLLALLGSQDPTEILQQTPEALRAAVERLSPEQVSRREAPGKWSTRHVIQHLADAELVGAFRLRMALAEERPPLSPYDQDNWADRLHYEDADVGEALERFTTLRRANLRLWAAASPAELARVGIHGERGEESVGHMRRMYAGHDLAHRLQLARIARVVTGH